MKLSSLSDLARVDFKFPRRGLVLKPRPMTSREPVVKPRGYYPMSRPLPGPDLRTLDQRLQAQDRDPVVPVAHLTTVPAVGVFTKRGGRRRSWLAC